MALSVLPSDVAEEMKKCSKKASWYWAKHIMGSRDDAYAEKVAYKQHAESFKKKSVGLLSTNTCDNIESMFWSAARYAAKKKSGHHADKEEMKEHYEAVVKIGEMTEDLASTLKLMGLYAAWYAANKIVRHYNEAKRYKAQLQDNFQKSFGDVTLVEMNFFTDKAKTLAEEPRVVANQTLNNNGDVTQTMAFKFTVTQGKTTSLSVQIGFKFGFKVGMGVGFHGTGGNLEASFELSQNLTILESIVVGRSKEYNFQLSVPAHSTYEAKATVNETKMEVPYEMVFDFSGTLKSIKGIWDGVAVSSAEYTVDIIRGKSNRKA